MTETLLQNWQDSLPHYNVSKPLATGEGVLDDSAFTVMEVDKLFASVNHAQTLIGQAVLFRSLAQPLDDLDTLQSKQQAVTLLQTNADWREAVQNIVRNAATQEHNFYRLLFGEFLPAFSTARNDYDIEGYGYLPYRRGVRFVQELVEQVQSLSTPDNAYLADILNKIRALADTRIYALMTQPVYVTEHSIQSKPERDGVFTPAVIFTPRLFKPVLITLFFAALWLGSQFLPVNLGLPNGIERIFLAPLLLLYFPIIGGFDRDSCIIPLRNQYKQCVELGVALDALGQLDELLSILKFAENFPHDTVLPTLIDSEHHRIRLHNAKNPVLGKDNPDYVGNDFVLEDDKLILITGPNSGGKTAFCKTVTQIQLLAQIGCVVPAQSATLTVADHIFYQAPEVSHLSDGEGRFGTELKRTKDIFLASTARSLIVLDEMSEGTTYEEKLESSTDVLNGFYRKGNSTLLITHNHQLVSNFVKRRTGLAKQVEFADELPTYRLVDGISRVSHADRVAKKIGFSKDDIERYLGG